MNLDDPALDADLRRLRERFAQLADEHCLRIDRTHGATLHPEGWDAPNGPWDALIVLLPPGFQSDDLHAGLAAFARAATAARARRIDRQVADAAASLHDTGLPFLPSPDREGGA